MANELKALVDPWEALLSGLPGKAYDMLTILTPGYLERAERASLELTLWIGRVKADRERMEATRPSPAPPQMDWSNPHEPIESRESVEVLASPMMPNEEPEPAENAVEAAPELEVTEEEVSAVNTVPRRPLRRFHEKKGF